MSNRIANRMFLCGLAMSLSVPSLSRADVQFTPIRVEGIGTQAARSIEQRFRQEYLIFSGDEEVLGEEEEAQSGGDNEVLSPSVAPGPSEAGAALDKEAKRLEQARAAEVVELRVTYLDGRFHFFAIRRGEDGTRIQAASTESGDSDRAIRKSIRQVASALAKEPDPGTAGRLGAPGTVAVHRKVRSLRLRYFYPLAKAQGFDPVVGLGFRRDYEGPRYFTGRSINVFIPNDLGGWNSRAEYGGYGMQLDGGYYLSPKSSTLYVAGGVEGRLQFGAIEPPTFALVPQFQFGVALGRNAQRAIKIQFEASQQVMPFTDVYYYWDRSSEEYYPTELGLSLTVER